MEILNKEAKFNYFVEDEIECGIVLLGSGCITLKSSRSAIP